MPKPINLVPQNSPDEVTGEAVSGVDEMANIRSFRAVQAGLIGMALLMSQAAMAGSTIIAYPPPAGMSLTSSTPDNGLQLQYNGTSSPIYLRQIVPYRTSERAGTIVVNTGEKFLYLVLPGNRALRYGIGVARDGFEWSGSHAVTAKRKWPGWTPPAEMRQRQPNLPTFMEGGPDNPLGARALYLGSTLYRIHGTNDPRTIGLNVSSGCIRLTNDDVIDLFGRVSVGSKVIVM